MHLLLFFLLWLVALHDIAHRVPPASWLWNGRGEEGVGVCQRVGRDCIMSAKSSTVKMVAQDRVEDGPIRG